MKDLFKKKKHAPSDAQQRTDIAAREIQAILIKHNCTIVPIIVLGPAGVVESSTRIIANEAEQ